MKSAAMRLILFGILGGVAIGFSVACMWAALTKDAGWCVFALICIGIATSLFGHAAK